MSFFELLFWLCMALVWYTYLGYGAVLYALVLVLVQRLFRWRRPTPDEHASDDHWPEVSLVVAAYNEENWIANKVANHLALDYPQGKLHHVIITDGSDDRTPEIARSFPGIEVYHEPERRGKIAAVHLVMPFLRTPIVVFTDANTLLNPEAIRRIVRHYIDPQVGAVAGEKRVQMSSSDAAHAAGEGIYWKYESLLKHLDSELYSVVGAAGELFSIRRELYFPVPEDTVIEDFFMTLTIAKGGHRVVYEPEAYAVEGPSASVPEELKRKIRIAAGGLQAIGRLKELLNPFKYGVLSFQYVSHRVPRWTLTTLALLGVLVFNFWLVSPETDQWLAPWIYRVSLLAQLLFYVLAITGYFLEKRKVKVKAFFIPYYFFVMNYAVFAGFWRNLRGKQTVLWEKAERHV